MKLLLILCLFFTAGHGLAVDSPEALLKQIKSISAKQAKENTVREQKFLAAHNKQAAMLKKAKSDYQKEVARGNALKAKFDKQEKVLAKIEEELNLAMGALGEMFGVVRQTAGEAKSQFQNSPVTIEYPERLAFMEKLSKTKNLPTISELEKLWVELQTEMTESGKVITYETDVTTAAGTIEKTPITRVGVFNVVSDGKYFNYDTETQKIIELGRQPQGRFLAWAEDLQAAKEGFASFGLDPSRGAILSLLIQAPNLWERVQQGGLVGYVILFIALLGMVIVAERFVVLRKVEQNITQELRSNEADGKGHVGQLVSTFESYKDSSVETLELKLDEVVLKATAKLGKGIKTVKTLAAVAPLLGLLGTVTGMIGTFQAITLFGAGDPKLMAGGISQALVTTVLGLVAAIPLILLHGTVSSRHKGIVETLEEKSTGLLAAKAGK